MFKLLKTLFRLTNVINYIIKYFVRSRVYLLPWKLIYKGGNWVIINGHVNIKWQKPTTELITAEALGK